MGYVPADDLTDPAPATTFAHLDATTVLSRQISELGIYPAVDPLDSTSRMLAADIVGDEHYNVARAVQKLLQDYKSLADIIAILGMDELTEDQKLTVARARKVQRFMSQPFKVAEVFTGPEGKFVDLETSVSNFKEMIDGNGDDIPEPAFLLKGDLEDVKSAAADMAEQFARERAAAAAGGGGDAEEGGDGTSDLIEERLQDIHNFFDARDAEYDEAAALFKTLQSEGKVPAGANCDEYLNKLRPKWTGAVENGKIKRPSDDEMRRILI